MYFYVRVYLLMAIITLLTTTVHHGFPKYTVLGFCFNMSPSEPSHFSVRLDVPSLHVF